MENETLTKDDLIKILVIMQDYSEKNPDKKKEKKIIEKLYNIARNIK